ncbi:MAG TPA: hypothetical protein DCQ50_19400 [Chryseobacterium sp.]|nr:hypothetical protein [Chryseobacterium sp.]
MKTKILFIILFSSNLIANAQKKIDKLVKEYETQGYSGTILVAKGNRILYASGYGISDQSSLKKNTVNTRYKTESIGKLFTATLVMQEIESGRLKLDDALEKFFPKVYQNGQNITIHHLLSHTSGFTETEMNPSFKPGTPYTRQQILELRSEAPRAFSIPGEKFQYSNLGYTLLAEILEKINGKSFDSIIHERIFNLSSMNNTGHVEDTIIYKNVAKPYVWLSSKKYMEETRMIGKRANASGGWISTVNDFYRFTENFISYKYIKPETWSIMKTANSNGGTEFQPGYFYTYGLNITNLTKDKILYGHTGGGGGYGCDLYFEPHSGYIVINFMNMYGDSRLMTKNIFRFLLNEKVEPVKKWGDVVFGDIIEAKGLEEFSKNYKQYLSEKGILPNTPGGFNRIASAYDDIDDQQTRTAILKAGLNEFPEGGILWLNLGRSLRKQGLKEEAIGAVNQGLKIAKKADDKFLQTMLNNEFSKLN